MNKTERESLEAQLEQNATDTRILLAGAEKERVRLEDLLAEPEMRHGEKVVRIDKNEPRIVLYNDVGNLVIFDERGTEQFSRLDTNLYRGSGETIFDDMKRNSEDLEEFKTFGRGCKGSQGIGQLIATQKRRK